MRTVKPHALSVLARTFELAGQSYLVVSGIVCIRFDRPKALVSEADLWKTVVPELGEDLGILDEGNAKARGEVLVTGKCHVPGGGPTPVSYVRVQIGSVDKRLAVFGDRRWRLGVPTEPEPFTEMPIDWCHAFGGRVFADNPVGKGANPVDGTDGAVHPLPNVEYPNHLIVGPGDRPTPAAYGAFDLTRPQRLSLVGTYDGDWLKERSPGYAADLDPSFFNVASEDQRIEGYFEGDEAFVLENMHPTEAMQAGSLPGAAVRILLRQQGDAALRDIPTRLDTVRFFPGLRVAVLVYRATAAVREDDAADVTDLVAAIEDRSARRSVEHYAAVLARKADKKASRGTRSHQDLLPPRELGWTAAASTSELTGMLKPDGIRRAHAQRRRAKELAHARTILLAKGLDPKDFGLDRASVEDPEPDWDDPEAVAEYADKQQQRLDAYGKEAEESGKKLEEEARKEFDKRGLDYDKAKEKAEADGSGPPKYKAQEQIAWLSDMLKIARDGGAPNVELEAVIANPKHRAKLLEIEHGFLDQYRKAAHVQPPAPARDASESERIRIEIKAAHENSISLSGRDFTGADLSDLKVPGLDLSNALLESVVLTRTDLSSANLRGAVLAHARLDRTILVGANLAGANLGGATLDEVDLTSADLSDVVLSRATVRSVVLKRARLFRVNTLETVWGAVPDFSEVEAEDLIFLKQDLSRACFSGAKLTKCTFVEVSAEEIDFSGAHLSRVDFLLVNAKRANFRDAHLKSTTFVGGTCLDESDFSKATADRALFRGMPLGGAKFQGAHLDGADFSEAILVDADLSRISARGALFIRTDLSRANMTSADLLGALLTKARLFGTDLRRASLFRADLARVAVDGATRLDEANLVQARIYPRARDGQG